jgi:prepilin-type N-terminal cleavage/methylation domain-containing protein
MRNKSGFTMIELIIVIAIIGILTAIAVPAFQNLSQSARVSATRGTLGAVRSALAVSYAQSATGGNNATYPATLVAANFADGRLPVNPMNGLSGVTALTGHVTSSTTASTTSGFWFVTGAVTDAGQAGAYAGTGNDTNVDVTTF